MFLDDKEWQIRHGRTTALVVGLKEAPELVYTDKRKDKIDKAVISMLGHEKVIMQFHFILQFNAKF
jgi:hypothetical protein